MLNRHLLVGVTVVSRAAIFTRPCTTKCVAQERFTAEEKERIGPVSDQRILVAAVIGSPNAGKSTLINNLIGQKVFAVTHKVQTTQRRALGVFTEGHSQVVVVDTPGVIPYEYGRKLKMSKSLRHDAYRSALDADMIVVIVDASNKWTRVKLDPGIVRILTTNESIPSVLVLNKIDLVKHKHVLLPVTSSLTCTSDTSKQHSQNSKESLAGEETLPVKDQSQENSSGVGDSDAGERVENSGWPHFSEVFMVSALTGDGMDSLRDHLTSSAKHGNWQYEVSAVTGEPMPNIAEDVIREKLFLHMNKEIPYVIKQDTYLWEEEDNGTIAICKNLICRKTSQATILIGPEGKTIQMVTHEAQNDLQRLWNRPVKLTLNVKSSKQ